jgi:glycosyltransferase involved in cell wall biosynthesis
LQKTQDMTIEPADRPLLTFAIVAFNQERFIREAVEAAFAQTYSPLEIILSDDCSPDRTFEIMRELAAAYTGPHRVILNRNPQRRSIGGHVNRVVELAHGELIVGAAGDDVSLPQRTQAAYQAWEWSGRKATSIHSDFVQIDEDGRLIDQVFKTKSPGDNERLAVQTVEPAVFVQTLKPIVFGCTHTFSRQLCKIFGDLPADTIHEDDALAFRSILAGQLVYINEPLVRYRLHGNNVFVASRKRGADLKMLGQQEDRHRRDFRNREIMHKTFLLDLEKAKAQGLIAKPDYEKAGEEAVRMHRRYSLMGKFWESGFLGKCRILSLLKREGLDRAETQFLLRRLIPRPLLLRIRLARHYAERAWNRRSQNGNTASGSV